MDSSNAVNDDADKHERHADKDDEMRGNLGTGHASVVVTESWVQVGNQISRDTKGHDNQSDH